MRSTVCELAIVFRGCVATGKELVVDNCSECASPTENNYKAGQDFTLAICCEEACSGVIAPMYAAAGIEIRALKTFLPLNVI